MTSWPRSRSSAPAWWTAVNSSRPTRTGIDGILVLKAIRNLPGLLAAAAANSPSGPGTVDVAVFPPIPVQDWTVETLPDRIAEVRQLYLDTLADWPAKELPEVDLYAKKKAANKARARAAKAPAKRAAPKTASTAAAKKAPPKSASKVALKDGEAQRPNAGETAGAESPGSLPRGRP